MQGIFIGIVLVFSLLLTEAFYRQIAKLPKKWRERIRLFQNVVALITSIVIGVLSKGWGGSIVRVLNRILGLYGMRLAVCLSVIAFGVAAHLWKQRNQRVYGMSEVCFGVMAVSFITFTLAPDKSFLSQWVGLGGAAYIVARGLNNVADAKKKVIGVAA